MLTMGVGCWVLGYWSGYFSSRPSLKRYVRVNSAALNVARHWEVFAGGNGSSTERLWEALSVVQHHDAVAGTARQVVTDDYVQRLSRGWAEADAALQRHLAAVLSATPSAPPISFFSCPLSNLSLCPTTQRATATPAPVGGSVAVVLLYNPLARNRTEVHSVPVQSSAVRVLTAEGVQLPSQLITLPNSTARLPDSAPYEVRFIAAVQGLGVETIFITATSDGRTADTEHAELTPQQPKRWAEEGRQLRPEGLHPLLRPLSVGSAASVSSPAPSAAAAAVTLENACWLLSVDATTGEWLSALDKATNRTFPASLTFLYYHAGTGRNGTSSHYTFSPEGDAIPVSSQSTLTRAVVQGNVTREVQVTVTDWLSYTLRLSMLDCSQGGAAIDIDYAIGPVPIDDRTGKVTTHHTHSSTQRN